MKYIVSRDKNKPYWKDLVDHVTGLNDKLTELIHSHLGNNVLAKLTDDKTLPKSTSGIASACLEVTDATCAIMAEMRPIIYDPPIVDKNKNIIFDLNKEAVTELPPSKNKTERNTLTIMELALSLSKFKKEEEIAHVLEQAISMMKSIPPVEQCSQAVDCVKVGKPKTIRNTRISKHTYRK